MRIKLVPAVALIFGNFALFSCIDEGATDEALLANDKAAIEAYLETDTLVNVKEFHDEATGLRVIWQELSNSGVEVKASDTLTVDYVGRLLSGKVFDTSIEDVAKDAGVFNSDRTYKPLVFAIGYGRLIPGFEIGLSKMEEGDKATVIIPSYYGYGKQGSSDGRIPANTPILFELDLQKVVEGPREQQ